MHDISFSDVIRSIVFRKREIVMSKVLSSKRGTVVSKPLSAECRQVLKETARSLAGWSEYRFPKELDLRMRDLGERKETLTKAEYAELRAWVKFANERMLDKLKAMAATEQLLLAFPELAENS